MLTCRRLPSLFAHCLLRTTARCMSTFASTSAGSCSLDTSDQPVLAVIGCTGVGKSKLAIELAERFCGQVISADSMQVYSELPIATNQVTQAEQARATHHLLGYVSPFPSTLDEFQSGCYTVTRFRDDALKVIADLQRAQTDVAPSSVPSVSSANAPPGSSLRPSRAGLPIIVGGTNYYIEALLWRSLFSETATVARAHPPSSPPATASASATASAVEPAAEPAVESAAPAINPALPSPLNFDLDALSPAELFAKLLQVDPIMANKYHKNDTRKLYRSLQVFQQYGVPHGELLQRQHLSAAQTHLPSEQSPTQSLSLSLSSSSPAIAPGASRFPPRFRRFAVIWIDCDQEVLNARMDSRVDDMLRQGLLGELRSFRARWRAHVASLGLPETERQEMTGDYTRGILQTIGLKEFEPLFQYEDEQEASAAAAVPPPTTAERRAVEPAASSDAPQGKLATKRCNEDADEPASKKPRLDALPDRASDSAWQRLYEQCVEQMKRATRKYSLKQISWMKRKFLPMNSAAPQGDGQSKLYILDSTDVSMWDDKVLQPAVRVAAALLTGSDEPLPDPSQVSTRPGRLEETNTNPLLLLDWKKHTCEPCKKTLNGDHEWKAHCGSNAHKRTLKAIKRRAATREYLEKRAFASAEDVARASGMIVDVVDDVADDVADDVVGSGEQNGGDEQ